MSERSTSDSRLTDQFTNHQLTICINIAIHPDVNATPIRRQYLEIKRKYPDCIVFFRLGDFFETFDADAELIARELNVTLTSRPVGKDTRVPMAGVPHHAINGYVARLIERGYRVAMADQLGSEAINGLVPREVKHVITPGTVIELAC